jgi:hypothetical protein
MVCIGVGTARERCWSICTYVSISAITAPNTVLDRVYLTICRLRSTPYHSLECSLADIQTIYLPPPILRRTAFSVPPQDAVDYRAVCFCHGEVVDIGFVCSVCLSSKSCSSSRTLKQVGYRLMELVFCKPVPVCQMCK